MQVKCPKCGSQINIGRLIGSIKSDAKAAAARLNGQKGGRPKQKRARAKRAKGRK